MIILNARRSNEPADRFLRVAQIKQPVSIERKASSPFGYPSTRTTVIFSARGKTVARRNPLLRNPPQGNSILGISFWGIPHWGIHFWKSYSGEFPSG